jgi:serine/threonine protein kinase
MNQSEDELRINNMQNNVIRYLNIDEDPKDVYDLLNSLGKGSYGYVFKALHKEFQEIHAVKIIKVQSVKIEDVLKEIEILEKCNSPFIGIHIHNKSIS